MTLLLPLCYTVKFQIQGSTEGHIEHLQTCGLAIVNKLGESASPFLFDTICETVRIVKAAVVI